jgi:hypothetical protein
MQSWTTDDLDAFAKRRGMLVYSGDARWLWRHAIRAGLEARARCATSSETYGVCRH